MSHMVPFNWGMNPVLRGGGWYDWPTPSQIFDQHFGMPALLEDPFANIPTPYWMRSRTGDLAQRGGLDRGMSEVINDKEKFQVNLDVSHFKPEEIKVRVVDNNLCVEGKHEEQMDEHGFISRHFTRKYLLPKEVDPATVQSNLSREGVLTIQAPKPEAIEAAKKERTVPISLGPNKPAVEAPKEKK